MNSFSVVRVGQIIPKRISAWMQQIAMLPKERGTIFRIKAVLAIKGSPNKHVLHFVMDVNDMDDALPWGDDEQRVAKIVFIGKGMDHKFLKDSFESLFEDATIQNPAAPPSGALNTLREGLEAVKQARFTK